jgi:DNA-binding NarL/FixJ family response regulator
MSDTIRVLIASDYCLTRSSLRQLLKQVSEFQVVAETDMPKDLADAQFRHSPDAILLVPGIHEVSYPATQVKQSPQSRVVMIGNNENVAYVRAVLAAGVLGYVLRKASENDLFLAIRSACQGRRFIDPLLSDSLADVLLGRIPPDGRRGEVRLSPRELQVLRGIVRGFTSRELAGQLGLTTKTIETYRCRIYDKLALKTRADLVEYALASGLLGEQVSS